MRNMAWCDDVGSKYYNKLIKTNKKIRHEKMFRKDNKYNLLIPINYNTIKPIKNKGSAIFIHLTKNYGKTLGCISLRENDFLVLLKIINKKTKIKILQVLSPKIFEPILTKVEPNSIASK